MDLGAFELNEPVPELKDPHAMVMLRPWIDVGGVGSLVLSWLELLYDAKELGRLSRPGNFFDFTRYRPIIYFKDGQRQVVIPNSYITYGQRPSGRDFLFLHLLEPHNLSEVYVESIVRVLQEFGVQRYCLIGSMYDLVPHTRPLLVTGIAPTNDLDQVMTEARVEPSDYEGPTTITFMVSQYASRIGMETIALIVHLPQYTQLDEDYSGFVRLMQVLSMVYGVPMDQGVMLKAEQQMQQVNAALEKDPQLKTIVEQLEMRYDARTRLAERGGAKLAPEVEKFLREMGQRLSEN